VAHEWDHAGLEGTLVCLPVLNVPGFIAQQRYLPIYDRDLNRSFPGHESSTSARRMAYRIFNNFVEPCDIGLDFHTSTRGRTNMLHVRADMDDPRSRAWPTRSPPTSSSPPRGRRAPCAGKRRTRAFRPSPSRWGGPPVPARPHRPRALEGVRSVIAEYGLNPAESVHWPGWRTVVDGQDEKTWIRADVGGLVEMHHARGAFVPEGDPICTITNPFKTETTTVEAPFPGLLVGSLETPSSTPGNPICHLVELDERTQRALARNGGVSDGD